MDTYSDKIAEIESKFLSNSNVMRDIIKKLIYTIETSFISGKH